MQILKSHICVVCLIEAVFREGKHDFERHMSVLKLRSDFCARNVAVNNII